MTRGHLDTVCEGVCPETDLLVFSVPVRVFFNAYPASGDGWNEPREPGMIEFDHATTGGKPITDPSLLIWAEKWLEAREEDAWEACGPDPDHLRELRQEQEWEERRQGDYA